MPVNFEAVGVGSIHDGSLVHTQGSWDVCESECEKNKDCKCWAHITTPAAGGMVFSVCNWQGMNGQLDCDNLVSSSDADWRYVDNTVKRADVQSYATLTKETEAKCVPLSQGVGGNDPLQSSTPKPAAPPVDKLPIDPPVLQPDKVPGPDGMYAAYVKLLPPANAEPGHRIIVPEGGAGGRRWMISSDTPQASSRRSFVSSEDDVSGRPSLLRGNSGQWGTQSASADNAKASSRRSKFQVEIVSAAGRHSMDLAHFLGGPRRAALGNYIIYTTDPSKRLDCETSDVLGEDGLMLLKSAVIRVARCHDGQMSAESQVTAVVRPGTSV